MKKVLSSVFCLFCFSTSLYSQKNATIPDSDPEIERKSFIVAPGFEVNLWAADPLLAKPIQMNWDPQGRLWVATSETYPQIMPGQKANDKIIILEDTKGIGVADKTTVFADGLLIPTGVEPGDGGAYVANSTELVHLSASKPGGKADKKKVLLSGFGTEDTHHIIHTFRWGPDGCLYFNQSIYIHSHIETPQGVQRLNAGGIWKYNPRSQDLSVFARGWINSWGHAFDKYGQSFTTDGAGGEGINHVIPGGYYVASQGPHAGRILHGLNPGSPKYCGLEIISGRHFPDDWQGDLITNDFRGHRVCRFKLTENGSSYSSREMSELIKTNHPAFRPIDVKMGPDGAIYIADWYNPIIQHGEVDFRDPRRDKTHGRIWRVTRKGGPLVPMPGMKLVNATVPELLEKLKEPEDWTRNMARRVIIEKSKELSDAVKSRNKQLSEVSIAEQLFLHINRLRIAKSIEDKMQIEKEIHEMLPKNFISPKDDNILGIYIRWLTDPTLLSSPYELGNHSFFFTPEMTQRLKLEFIRACAKWDIPTPLEEVGFNGKAHPARFALTALELPMDPSLDYALWLTMRELEPQWLPAFQRGEITFGNDPKKIAFAMKASGKPEAIKTLVAMMKKKELPEAQRREFAKIVVELGNGDDLSQIMGSGVITNELTRGIEEAFRTRKLKTTDTEAWGKLPVLFSDPEMSDVALRMAGHLKMESQRSEMESIVADSMKSMTIRKAAIDGIVSLGGSKTLEFLQKLSDSKTADRSLGIEGLIQIDPAKAIAKLNESLANVDLPSVVSQLASRRNGAAPLVALFKKQTLPANDAKAILSKFRTSGINDANLFAAISAAGKLNAPVPIPNETQIKAIAAQVMEKGNAARGESIYRRAELQCLKCHAIAGAGGQVGPDMTSLGASAPVDYIVEALLNPNAKIKEGYNAIRVVTADGKEQQGIKVREADGKLVIRNSEDREISIALSEIEEKKDSRSLMPDGLTQPLTDAEFLDLAKFLSELGKVGEYAPSQQIVFRRWEVVDATGTNTERMRRTRATIAAEAENGLTWSPMVAKVNGELPLAELPIWRVWNNANEQSAMRTTLDVSQPGKVQFKFNSVMGVSLFIDGKPVDEKSPVELTAGLKSIVVMIDRGLRKDNLKLELIDVAGSKAIAKPILK